MDLEVLESLNGGDLIKNGNDLAMVFSFENMPYLALFGGNVKESTPTVRKEAQQAFDWWGNSLFINEPSIQINSLTERTLLSVALTSSGRLIIEEAIKADLEFMREFAIVKVETEIIATDVIRIAIGLTKPDNLELNEFVFIWEQGRLKGQKVYNRNTQTQLELLEYLLEFELVG